MTNNNKEYGLKKERELKKHLLHIGASEVVRARGSFGTFDIIAFFPRICWLVSCKAVRQNYWSPNTEIKKLKEIPVPHYCYKKLYIWWSPNKNRDRSNEWEVYNIGKK